MNKDERYNMRYTEKDMDFKMLDKDTFLWSIVMFIVGLIITVVFSTIIIGGLLNFGTIFQIFGLTLIIFSLCFIGLTLIAIIISGLLRLIFNVNENTRIIYYIKIMISVITVVIFLTYTIVNLNSAQLSSKMGTEQLLTNQINTPGIEGCTDKITVSKNLNIVDDGVLKYTGLKSEQLFFINPYDISLFTLRKEELADMLFYNAQLKSALKICIICNNGKTRLQNSLDAYNLGITIDSTIENKPLCAIYPKKA